VQHPVTETNQKAPSQIPEEVCLAKAVQLLLAQANEGGLVSASALRGQMPISTILQVLKTLEGRGILSSENNQRFIKVEAALAFLSSHQDNTQSTSL
jgi:hypothetical protein